MRGQIRYYSTERGFGFIRSDTAGESDVFFHASQWLGEDGDPVLFQPVEFDRDVRTDTGKHAGKVTAFRVKPIPVQIRDAESRRAGQREAAE